MKIFSLENKSRFEKVCSILMLAAVILSILCAALVLIQLFAPALAVGEQMGNSVEYEYNSYSGIDIAFLCWPKFILGGQLIGPNPLLIAALVLPVIATLVCLLLCKKNRPAVRAIACIVMAVCFVFCAACMLGADEHVLDTAYEKFITVIHYAKEHDMYKVSGYTVFMSVICFLAAVVDMGAAVFFISKKTARREIPTEEKQEPTEEESDG